MKHRLDRWQVSLTTVIMLMLVVVLGMALGVQGAYAWSPPSGENVILDNGCSFSGKTTTGTERPMLTLINTNAIRVNAPPAGAMFFTVANTEMMRISNAGNVGIGDGTPVEGKLVVRGSGAPSIYGRYGTDSNYGCLGTSTAGVFGSGLTTGIGVYGSSSNSYAVEGYSSSGRGVYGHTSGAGPGVYGSSASGDGVYGTSTSGYAGYFNGPLHITGALTKGSGSFKIDHPQDPENRYLYHSFVESPEMMNVYNGNATLDENGEAVVHLPSYFESLNRDFRYQLTCIGGFAPVYIASEIQGNSFKIAGGSPDMKVSWMVTGIRQDAYASAHPLVVEQEKPENEKGYYMHPKEWGQPEEKGIDTLR